MFENIKDFKHIIVSGPQRSGTRILAKIISHDTGKDYIDEKDINFHDFRLLRYYLQRDNIVVQCPSLCHKLHEIYTESTIIIMVRRPIDEIINSERRLNWADSPGGMQELFKYGCSQGVISRIKYEYWDSFQKPSLGPMAVDFNYHDLKDHPLFIKERVNFAWDQTV